MRDDGRDMDLATVQEKGAGPASLKQRAMLLGGTLSITSTPGEGTRPTISFAVSRDIAQTPQSLPESDVAQD